MIGTKTFALILTLAATAGAAAGVTLGLVTAVWTDRLLSAWEPIDWTGADDE